MDSVERHIGNNLRTFIAVKVIPDEKAAASLKDIRTTLQTENILWNKTENFHITLLFIGSTPIDMLYPIQESMDFVASQTHPFDFFISGIGVFRTINHPRVLWLGVNESKALKDLKELTDKSLFPLLKMEAREQFKPHLTIGRMRRINDLKNLEALLRNYKTRDFLKVKVQEIIFYESITTSGGPVYRSISNHTLKKDS